MSRGRPTARATAPGAEGGDRPARKRFFTPPGFDKPSAPRIWAKGIAPAHPAIAASAKRRSRTACREEIELR